MSRNPRLNVDGQHTCSGQITIDASNGLINTGGLGQTQMPQQSLSRVDE
ncbi:MAG: hypothetical protein H2061_04885 [Burkholderiales bacterium]|nr:hypothetical protein [Burkholderiales bacterium]